MKKQIINWIEHLFGIDMIKKRLEEKELYFLTKIKELNDINEDFQKKYRQLQSHVDEAVVFEKVYESKVKDLQDLMSVLNKGKIGMDVAFGPNSRSWAIVCLGKTKEAVHFYQFPDSEMKDLNMFLRDFSRNANIDRKNQIIDCPFGSNIFF